MVAAVVGGLVLAVLGALAFWSGKDAVSGQLMRRHRPAAVDMDLSPTGILLKQLERTDVNNVNARWLLHRPLGNLFHDQGRYIEACSHYKQAAELAPSREDRAAVLRRRGHAEVALGRLAAAAETLLEALREGGEEADGAVEAWHGLGDARAEQGKLAEAMDIYQRGLRIAERQGDMDEVILLLADIAEVQNRAGHTDEAKRWLTMASEKLATTRGKEPSSRALVAAKVDSYWASTHHNEGDVVKATTLYERAVQAQAARLRPSHPDLLASRVGLARTQRDSGDAAGSVKAMEVVEQTLRSGPNEGPDLSRVLILKADMLRVDRELGVAQVIVEEAQRLQEHWFEGASHPEAAVALACYGSILHDAGQLSDARARYEQALEMNLKTVGEMHPETAAVYNSLGTLLQDTHEPLEAFGKFAKCLNIQRATVGEMSPDVANTYNNMATVLYQQGRAKEAAHLLKKAISILDASGVPKGSPERVLYEENLGEMEKSKEDDDEQFVDVDRQHSDLPTAVLWG